MNRDQSIDEALSGLQHVFAVLMNVMKVPHECGPDDRAISMSTDVVDMFCR